MNKKGWIYCRSALWNMNHNVLLPDGRVLLCCMDYAMNHVLGNLIEMDYKDLFQTKIAEETKKAFREEKIVSICRKCEVAEKINIRNLLKGIWRKMKFV